MRRAPVTPSRLPRSNRRGFVLVATIVCMLVASIVTASVMQRSVRHRLEVQRRLWQSQADWLAQSAVRLAEARLASAENYRGEIWRPQCGDAQGPSAANVEIKIQMEDDQRWISVLVNYPAHPFQRAQSRLLVPLEPKPKAKS